MHDSGYRLSVIRPTSGLITLQAGLDVGSENMHRMAIDCSVNCLYPGCVCVREMK